MFLSYAREEDEDFVARFYRDPTVAGFTVWWDRVDMPNRALTFHQEIRDAVVNYQRLLVVLCPKAVASDYVRDERQHALLVCNAVLPVLRGPVPHQADG